jgi:transposase-like protein
MPHAVEGGAAASEFTQELQRLLMGDMVLSPLSLIRANPELAAGAAGDEERFDDAELPFLWADGIHLGAGPHGEKRVLLLVLGADQAGMRRIVEIRCVAAETEKTWLALFRDLRDRGLRAPALITADGTAAFWRAVKKAYPETKQQWCWLHVERQVLDSLSGIARSRALTALRGIARAANEDEARTRILALASSLHSDAPFLAASLRTEIERLVAYLRFDPEIRVTLRTTHAVEAIFTPVAL